MIFGTLQRHLKEAGRVNPSPFVGYDPYLRVLHNRITERQNDYWSLFAQQQLANDPHLAEEYRVHYLNKRKKFFGLLGEKRLSDQEVQRELGKLLAKNKRFLRVHQTDRERVFADAERAELDRFAAMHPEKNNGYQTHLSKRYQSYRPAPAGAATQAQAGRNARLQMLRTQYPSFFQRLQGSGGGRGPISNVINRINNISRPHIPRVPGTGRDNPENLVKKAIQSFLKKYWLGISVTSGGVALIVVVIFFAIGMNSSSQSPTSNANDCNGYYTSDLQVFRLIKILAIQIAISPTILQKRKIVS